MRIRNKYTTMFLFIIGILFENKKKKKSIHPSTYFKYENLKCYFKNLFKTYFKRTVWQLVEVV